VYAKKVKWGLMGVFALELVIIHTAWSQWLSARELSRIVRAHLDKQVCTLGRSPRVLLMNYY
jgi:hypothetical protein